MAACRHIPAAFAAVFLALPAAGDPNWTRPPAKDGFEYPDCYCTNRGERVPMGGTACLRIGSDAFLARCEMSLNNPTWRRVREGCPPVGPNAALPGSGVEAVEPG